MSDFERGSDYLPNNQAKEIANCKEETCANLGNLRKDIDEAEPIPTTVTDYLSANASDEARPLALEKILAMQRNNPNLFQLPPTVLPAVLAPIIENSEIAALDALENKLDVENANLDKKIGVLPNNWTVFGLI